MKKILSSIIIFILSFNLTFKSHADEPLINDKNTVIELKMGRLSPFDGTLLSKDVAEKLFARLKTEDDRCKIKIDHELSLQKIELDRQVKLLELQMQLEKEKNKDLFSLRDERIKWLEQNLKPSPWYRSGEFLFSMGVLAGIGVSVGVSYAISHSIKN